MPFLSKPASYCSLAELKADGTLDLTDRNGAAHSDDTLSALLSEHSGKIDSLIGQSFLPQEAKLRYYGDDSSVLILNRSPIIYVRQVQIELPGSGGFDVPVQSLLIDTRSGVLENVTPLTFQSFGVTTAFPARTPIDVTFAWGLGYPIPPPAFTAQPAGPSASPFPAGDCPIQLTSVTENGESMPSAPVNVTLDAPGAISVVVTNTPGAMRFNVYALGKFVSELQAYALGNGLIERTFDASTPTSPAGFNFDGSVRGVPTEDTSAFPLEGKYAALKRVLKMMVQSTIWESKNPSNQGIFQMQSGPQRLSFKDNTKSVYAADLADLVESLRWVGVG